MRLTLHTTLPAVALAALAMACAPAAPVATPAPALDRATPPAPLPERPIGFPDFHEFTLANGLPVIVLEHPGQPLANINLYIRSGTALDPAEQAGRAGLTAELLTKGTERRSATDISRTIEGVGGTLSTNAGQDNLTVSSSVLVDDLPLAFDLLSDVALRPTFPEEEVERERRRTLSGLRVALGQPGELARRQFIEQVYGVEHPYGVSPVPGTVEGLVRSDLESFHREHFAPRNALLVVSGQVDRAQVERLAEEHFGGWQGTAAAGRATLPTPAGAAPTRIHLVHRPGSTQSNIWIGHLATEPGHPDYFPLQVLNSILGGGVDARLFQILREEKGWTYGAYSRFTRPQDIGYFSANAEVRTEVTDSAVAEILHQLHRLRDEPVPQAEFDAAVSFLAGSFPLRLETPGQVASQIAQMRLLGLPIEEVSEFPLRIREVTPEQVRRAARDHVRPDEAVIVVVGDATRIMADLEPIAPISLYDVEGAPLQPADLAVRGSDMTFDGSRLQPGTRTYRFMVQGNPMGTSTSTLARDGDAWVATSVLESGVMNQESTVRFGAADLRPLAMQSAVTQGPMRIATDLRVEGDRLAGTIEAPEQAGGDQEVDAEAVSGMLLPGMDEYALAAADLEVGTSITLPVFNAMGGSVANVTMRVEGIETVEVPAGTFEAYRVQVSGEQPMTLHLRRDAPHILVKQELAGMPIMLELQSMD
jgi:zinc protease